MTNKILDFIKKRFPTDCNGLTGNCYYFAIILKSRFPEGEIYYDVVRGHFLFKYGNKFYDGSGLAELTDRPIKGSTFAQSYDSLEYARIIRDCVE